MSTTDTQSSPAALSAQPLPAPEVVSEASVTSATTAPDGPIVPPVEGFPSLREVKILPAAEMGRSPLTSPDAICIPTPGVFENHPALQEGAPVASVRSNIYLLRNTSNVEEFLRTRLPGVEYFGCNVRGGNYAAGVTTWLRSEEAAMLTLASYHAAKGRTRSHMVRHITSRDRLSYTRILRAASSTLAECRVVASEALPRISSQQPFLYKIKPLAGWPEDATEVAAGHPVWLTPNVDLRWDPAPESIEACTIAPADLIQGRRETDYELALRISRTMQSVGPSGLDPAWMNLPVSVSSTTDMLRLETAGIRAITLQGALQGRALGDGSAGLGVRALRAAVGSNEEFLTQMARDFCRYAALPTSYYRTSAYIWRKKETLATAGTSDPCIFIDMVFLVPGVLPTTVQRECYQYVSHCEEMFIPLRATSTEDKVVVFPLCLRVAPSLSATAELSWQASAGYLRYLSEGKIAKKFPGVSFTPEGVFVKEEECVPPRWLHLCQSLPSAEHAGLPNRVSNETKGRLNSSPHLIKRVLLGGEPRHLNSYQSLSSETGPGNILSVIHELLMHPEDLCKLDSSGRPDVSEVPAVYVGHKKYVIDLIESIRKYPFVRDRFLRAAGLTIGTPLSNISDGGVSAVLSALQIYSGAAAGSKKLESRGSNWLQPWDVDSSPMDTGTNAKMPSFIRGFILGMPAYGEGGVAGIPENAYLKALLAPVHAGTLLQGVPLPASIPDSVKEEICKRAASDASFVRALKACNDFSIIAFLVKAGLLPS